MSQFKGEKILVVEDNQISYKLIEAHLRKKDLHLIHAFDGYEALKIFESTADINLVLMDIQLPSISGLDVTREIRKTNKIIPIIATTANVFDEDRHACEEAGCSHFISKPINFDDLIEIMKQYIR